MPCDSENRHFKDENKPTLINQQNSQNIDPLWVHFNLADDKKSPLRASLKPAERCFREISNHAPPVTFFSAASNGIVAVECCTDHLQQLRSWSARRLKWSPPTCASRVTPQPLVLQHPAELHPPDTDARTQQRTTRRPTRMDSCRSLAAANAKPVLPPDRPTP